MSNYHLIVYGATSFVGQLLTRYLFERMAHKAIFVGRLQVARRVN